MEEFQQKLRAKTPIGRLGELGPREEKKNNLQINVDIIYFQYADQSEGKHPYQEKEPLEAFPDNINPQTGEQGLFE